MTKGFNESDLVLINATKMHQINIRFKKDQDAMFIEAKRSTVEKATEIPMWFYGLTLILGWNELMVIVFNPILTVFVSIILGSNK